MSKSINRSSHEWRRFELCTDDQMVLAELDAVLDRADITRRELAVIATSLRIRPDFSLKDFGTDQTYVVTERCPNCKNRVEIHGWDTDVDGFEAYCPYCGNRLMLCDECRHLDNPVPCDYNRDTDSCCKQKEGMKNAAD